MCILNGIPKRVSDTQIFAFPTGDGRHQVTVYSNRVDLLPGQTYMRRMFGGSDPVAMILPFPKGECEMIDTTQGGDLFETLDRWFQTEGSDDESQPLQVSRCGSYRYSIVPDLAGFGRIDSQVFALELMPHVRQLLHRNYGHMYSFLVCIIDASAKYQPIAYKHALTDGEGGPRLFVPTLHEHGSGSFEWDHSIYLIGNDMWGQEVVRPGNGDDMCRGVRSAVASLHDKIAAYLPDDVPCNRFRKFHMRGDFPNVDLTVSVALPVGVAG